MDFGTRAILIPHALLDEEFDTGDRFACITDGKRLDLIGHLITPGGERLQDTALDAFPVRCGLWLLEILDGTIEDKSRRTTPTFKYLSLGWGWRATDLLGFGYGIF